MKMKIGPKPHDPLAPIKAILYRKVDGLQEQKQNTGANLIAVFKGELIKIDKYIALSSSSVAETLQGYEKIGEGLYVGIEKNGKRDVRLEKFIETSPKFRQLKKKSKNNP